MIDERLAALFHSARGVPKAPLEVYHRLQFFSRVMRHAPASAGTEFLLLWFDEAGHVKSIGIGTEPIVIGREPGCDVVLIGARVSRRQCAVRAVAGGNPGAEIEDLGSSNGTMVNGRPLEPHRPHPLRDGDVVEIGGMALACVGPRPRMEIVPLAT